IMLGTIKGVPNRAFVNDVRADLYDSNTVYLVLDNHKEGDYKPYLLKSTNKGASWTFMNGDLPKKLITWRVVQDHKKKELLFAATEYGIYFTYNGGINWLQLDGGLPTIPFRDITIQRREDDLVGASFGRGFYVLDDMSPLRDFDVSKMSEATLFKVRPAHWYIEKSDVGSQGNSEYIAKNPPYGATFTYFLPEQLKTLKESRSEREKNLNKQKANISFPGWEALEKEKSQKKPVVFLTVKDDKGNVVNTIAGTNKKGFNRVSWNLTYADRTGIALKEPKGDDGNFFGSPFMVSPGSFTVELYQRVDGQVTQISSAQKVEVKRLLKGALPGKPTEEIDAFRAQYVDFRQDLKATNSVLDKSILKINAMDRAIHVLERPSVDLVAKIYDANSKLQALKKMMNGSPSRNEVGEKTPPSPGDGSLIGYVALRNTYGPTGNQKAALQRADNQLKILKQELNILANTILPALETELKTAGAPWIEGQGLIED
ncbi:MAG: glycosyl hydrolase, partial [Flavobacteriaceae bacterium]